MTVKIMKDQGLAILLDQILDRVPSADPTAS